MYFVLNARLNVQVEVEAIGKLFGLARAIILTIVLFF